MKPDEEGFLQPVVDKAKCVNCSKCGKVCPVLHHGKPRKPLAVYAAKAKDDELRAGSASGGIFTLLALDVLKRGGVVFGAGFERPTWRVIHKAAHNKEELDDLRGSKYVQSDVGNTYTEAKQLLDDGREVLYSGCPCQIAALLNFLKKPYPNLTTVDLVCHGVPSPLAWRKYLNDREREAGAPIYSILPRRYCKWLDFTIQFKFTNGASYSETIHSDMFMRSFVLFWDLRPSCFSCQFRNFASGSSCTIGDYSNIGDTHPEFCDDKGVSFIANFQNSAHGAALDRIHGKTDTLSMPLENICKINTAIFEDHPLPAFRKKFYLYLQERPFDACVHNLLSRRYGVLLHQCLWWIKRLIINREMNHFNWP